MPIPEQGRLAAHVPLDAASVFDSEVGDPKNAETVDLALERLNEVGAVSATFDDETDEVTLNATDLIGGTVTTLMYLIGQLSLSSGEKEHDVIAKTREFLDTA